MSANYVFLQVLWGTIGQTLVSGLDSLRRSATYLTGRTISMSQVEITVTASLNRVLEAMNTLREVSPLIGTVHSVSICISHANIDAIDDELRKLRAFISNNQAGVL